MQIKPGADVRFLRPEVTARLWTIEQCFRHHAPDEYTFVLTSGSDGTHSANSLHYKGLAVDIRRWYMADGKRTDLGRNTLGRIRNSLAKALGSDWDIILESSHMHLEFDPPRVV